MKEMKLKISCARLYGDVARTTAYLGARQAPAENPGEHFDRIAVTDADHIMLLRFSDESLSALAERLKGLVTAVNTGSATAPAPTAAVGQAPGVQTLVAPAVEAHAVGEIGAGEATDEIGMTLALSAAYDDSLSGAVSRNFESYMSAAVTARWLRLVNPEKEGTWRTEADRLCTEIVSALYHRNPPVRRSNYS